MKNGVFALGRGIGGGLTGCFSDKNEVLIFSFADFQVLKSVILF
jgi:hypothetical protein